MWTFLKVIIQELKTFQPELLKVCIFSDGCAGQFKNKYTLSTLVYSMIDFGVIMDWTFFGSSRGKGAVDGVGGLVYNVYMFHRKKLMLVNQA